MYIQQRVRWSEKCMIFYSGKYGITERNEFSDMAIIFFFQLGRKYAVEI